MKKSELENQRDILAVKLFNLVQRICGGLVPNFTLKNCIYLTSQLDLKSIYIINTFIMDYEDLNANNESLRELLKKYEVIE